MFARPRSVVAAVLTLTLATPVRAAETCPNEQASAGAEANLGHCLGDAREAEKAGEPRLAAAAYARALTFARMAYDAGKVGATAGWFTEAGEETVLYGTRGCAQAVNLGPVRAREVLGSCIELLDAYLVDLEAAKAVESRSAAAARQRRGELQPVLDGLPRDEPATVPEPAVKPGPALLDPAAALVKIPEVERARPRPPRGLDAGIGVSAGIAGLAIVGLVVADVRGRDASARAPRDPLAADVPVAADVCATEPAIAACGDLTAAKRLFIASGALLGVALAATAVFVGLRVRHGRSQRRVQSAGVMPTAGGLQASVALRF